MPPATEPSTVHVAVLSRYKIAFAEPGHARELVARWNLDHAGTIAEAQSDGHHAYADNLTGRVEEWAPADWARQPSGRAPARTRLPDQQQIFTQHIGYTGFIPRRPFIDSGLTAQLCWDFQSNHTASPAEGHLEDRAHGAVDLHVRGTDRQAVAAKVAKLVGKAESLPGPGDLRDPITVLAIVRGVSEGNATRYTTSRYGYSDAVRAAIVCGLIAELDGQPHTTAAGLQLHHTALATLPGSSTSTWEEHAEIHIPIQTVKHLFASAFNADPTT